MGLYKKIFIGARVTPELKHLLQLQAFVLEDLQLKKVEDAGKEYIGSYLESTSYAELKSLTHQISLKLSTLFPEKLLEPAAFSILSQTFIS